MRILVSTKIRMPSGTSSSGLFAIFGLLDDLLYQRVLSHGESGKGAVDNARGLLTACSEMLQPEPHHLLYILLVFRQPAQQRIRHVYGDLCHGDTLLEGYFMGRTGYRSSHGKRHTISSSLGTRSTEGILCGSRACAFVSTSRRASPT